MCESELSVNRKERLVGSPFSVILMKRGLQVPINIDININQAKLATALWMLSLASQLYPQGDSPTTWLITAAFYLCHLRFGSGRGAWVD